MKCWLCHNTTSERRDTKLINMIVFVHVQLCNNDNNSDSSNIFIYLFIFTKRVKTIVCGNSS